MIGIFSAASRLYKYYERNDFDMRKFLSVLVAVTMCICLLVPAAFAADDDSLSKLFEGVDLSSLSDEELESVLGGLNLEGVDLETIKDSFGSGDSSTLGGLEDIASSIGSDSSFSLDSLSSLFGDMDMSWITDAVSDPSAILDMFSGASGGSFDMNALMDMISGAFGGAGLDLESITSGMDLGSFDIMSVLGMFMGGSGNVASGATDIIATITDALKGGLESLGLDASMLEGLLDNDIVNFFANLFIGGGSSGSGASDIFGGIGDIFGGSDDAGDSGNAAPAPENAPATPNTGDTSAVFVAIGTLSVAAAAAFVCLKKKD